MAILLHAQKNTRANGNAQFERDGTCRVNTERDHKTNSRPFITMWPLQEMIWSVAAYAVS